MIDKVGRFVCKQTHKGTTRGIQAMDMKNITKGFRERCDGAVLPMVAIMFPVIMGMAGVGVDMSNWMMQKRNLQTAADAAAIAGAYEYVNGDEENVEAAALREAENNGYSAGADSTIEVSIVEIDGQEQVQVTVRERANTFMAGLLYNDTAYTATLARAEAGGGDGDFCMLSLDDSANGAISTQGNVTIDAAGCGIAVNSNSDSALDIDGNSEVDIGQISIVGGMDVGNNADVTYSDLDTGVADTPDPYEDLVAPEGDPCSREDSRQSLSITGDATLSPGTYCGGISIANGSVDFEPGVYIIDGGDFSITTNGDVFGEGVSFVLKNSGEGSDPSLQIAAGGNLTFSAPTEGEEMEGVVFYQDRNIGEHASNSNRLTGTASLNIEGVAYFPENDVFYGGGSEVDSDAESPCSLIIARTITLAGNPVMGNNCQEDSGVRDIEGPPGVRLVY